MKAVFALTAALLATACSGNDSDNSVATDTGADQATAVANLVEPLRTPTPQPSATATASPLAQPAPARDDVAVGSDPAANGTDADAADLPPIVTARYRCVDGSRYTVRFDNRADTATLLNGDKRVRTLAGQRPASGIWYKGEGWELRGKGRQATLTKPDGPSLPCIS